MIEHPVLRAPLSLLTTDANDGAGAILDVAAARYFEPLFPQGGGR